MAGEGWSKLTLEDYDNFFHLSDSHRRGLPFGTLKQIVRMHTAGCFKTKIPILESLRRGGIMPPTRSTLRNRAAFPCAALSLDEIRADIAALGWQECPIGSLATANPKTAAPPAEDHLGLLSAAAAAASHSNAASSAVGKGKKLKRRTPAAGEGNAAAIGKELCLLAAVASSTTVKRKRRKRRMGGSLPLILD